MAKNWVEMIVDAGFSDAIILGDICIAKSVKATGAGRVFRRIQQRCFCVAYDAPQYSH